MKLSALFFNKLCILFKNGEKHFILFQRALPVNPQLVNNVFLDVCKMLYLFLRHRKLVLSLKLPKL